MPLVTVLLATHDDARYLRAAIDSVLRQTVEDLELLVIDDASTDETPELLDAVDDARLRILRNDAQLGLAGSLNRGLDHAQGKFVARLDADDVALPERLERQLERIEATGVAALGSAILDIDAEGERGREHRMPVGAVAVRWHALFSSPFFHPTVLVDREALERRGLRYDVAFRESEDYDLWTRLLALGVDGGNVPEALVLKRVHSDQASLRRGRLQRSFQRKVALREIGRISSSVDAELAWSFGINASRRPDAARAYRELLRAFERKYGPDEEVRTAAARRLARGRSVGAAARIAVTRRRHADGRPPATRVTVISPEPTPYRSPLFDRIAARGDIELTVVYAAPTVAARRWNVEPRHRAVFLRGVPIRALRPVLRHDYPVTPGIGRALRASRPDAVVVSGWSTFAAQGAVAWCRRHGVPYVLLVESHDAGPRAAWRRAVKDTLVPPIVRGAAACLAVGTLARESLIARGARADRVRVFANTIDVEAWITRAGELADRREELRTALGAEPDDVVVLSVGRLVPEKGFPTLLDAASALGDDRILVTIAGSGPEHAALASQNDIRLRLLGEVGEQRLAEAYVAADVFALLSTHEPWGVVVNEAAASGLPLVLSDRVGAGRDLLREGENGHVVAAGDPRAVADAIRMFLDPEERRHAGARSRELVQAWDYDSSVDAFVATVREVATAR